MNSTIAIPFDEALKSAGFHKKSGSWYLDRPEAILVANLQKSNYGDQYYVNLAIWIKAISKAEYPKENKCQVRLRLDSLVDERDLKCFDGEETITPSRRAKLINSLITGKAIPFLLGCGTLDGIGGHLASGGLDDALVHFKVEELLSKKRGEKYKGAF